MCGIAGYYLTQGLESSTARLLAMLRRIRHRGPDDEGITLLVPESGQSQDLTTDESAQGVEAGARLGTVPELAHRIGIGHRRFSIIDVSAAGHQPFWTADRRICVAFNGEVYNYIELRAELARLGHRFRTDSDTEVLAEAYREWGVECFPRFNGFWGLTLYDASSRKLLLARDRIGKAPLYVTRAKGGLFWCSEIKGLFTALGQSSFRIRDQALVDFLTHLRRDLFHETFYEGIVSLPSASYAWVEPDGSYRPVRYWSVPTNRLSASAISVADAGAGLRDRLANAVRLRQRADVPLGMELSGGLDSSSLLALAAQSEGSIRAFTVSFPGTQADEEPYARKVVDHYRDRVEYTILQPPHADLLENADHYIDLMEEPFHSPNMLASQNILREMSGMNIRVSINGGAGDEVLAGYGIDYFVPFLKHLLKRGRLVRFAQEFFGYTEHRRGRFGADYLRRLYRLVPKPLLLYHNSAMDIPPDVEPFRRPASAVALTGPSTELNALLIDNLTEWRMNYWMRSANQSAMGVPVEVRAPFLDHQVVDYCFRLPVEYLIRDGWMKWILRKAMADLLPADVIWRKVKMGFPFPLKQWLPANKRQFFEAVKGLDCPYVDIARLQAGYDEIGRRDEGYLWRLMSVALWWKRCVQGESLNGNSVAGRSRPGVAISEMAQR